MKPIDHSSWISEVLFKNGFLLIVTQDGEGMLYSGVPSFKCGLLQAGTVKEGNRSVGTAYHRFIKGQYQYQSLDREKANSARKMMNR